MYPVSNSLVADAKNQFFGGHPYQHKHSKDDERIVIDQILLGLNQRPKKLPTMLLYDEKGSELFDKIVELDEYYVGRAELQILRKMRGELTRYVGEKIGVVELGSGSSLKSEVLVNQLDVESYVCVDISDSALISTAYGIQNKFPHVKVRAINADFTKLSLLPRSQTAAHHLLFFPGSTIGNFEPSQAQKLLMQYKDLLNPTDSFLIGIDLKKDPKILHAAYNDAQGITAKFNLNLLRHVNRITRGNLDPKSFVHKAIYNPEEGRVEMHLISKRDQTIKIAGRFFNISEGEIIHTENSYKYSIEEFTQLARNGGFHVDKTWTDNNNLFSVHLLRVNEQNGIH